MRSFLYSSILDDVNSHDITHALLDPLSQQLTVGLTNPTKLAHERVTGSIPARGRLEPMCNHYSLPLAIIEPVTRSCAIFVGSAKLTVDCWLSRSNMHT